MGRRSKTIIGTALGAVGLFLAAGSVAARPDEAPPRPAPERAGAAASRPLDLPPTPAGPRAGTKSQPDPKSQGPRKAAPVEAAPPDPAADLLDTPPPADLGPVPTPFLPAESEPVEPPAPAAGLPAPAAPGKGDAKAKAAPPEPADPALPPAPALPPPPGTAAPASTPRVDDAVGRAQAPAAKPAPNHADSGPLPPAAGSQAPPAHSPAAGGTPKEADTPFVLPAESLPLGRQTVGLTVDVVAPDVLNRNQSAHLKILVRNSGKNDAIGVVVRDELPPGLTYLGSQPEAQRLDSLLSWNLGTVPAGAERSITVSVKPNQVGSFDHAATVSMKTGGKSRTAVREPKLKVEQVVSPTGKVLKGQPAQFKITVSNPGDGPAKNVLVQAKLSPGLRHESGEPNDQNLFEQTIPVIEPNQRVEIEPLVADTILGGEQSCQVAVKSPDVVAGAPEAVSTQGVTVVEPKLTLAISGDKERLTDMLATYDITLSNPGTDAARNVKVLATLPVSGRLFALPSGARFDPQTRKLSWARPALEAGEKATLSFQVRMGGVGLYQVASEARADGALLAKGIVETDVSGMSDVTFDVSEKRRVIDVDAETTYVIKVVNSGTKEATNLLVSAVLPANIKPGPTSGTDEAAGWDEASRTVKFPVIARLGPGKSMELGIRVKALKPGLAVCRVSLLHDDLTEKLNEEAAFKVMPVRR